MNIELIFQIAGIDFNGHFSYDFEAGGKRRICVHRYLSRGVHCIIDGGATPGGIIGNGERGFLFVSFPDIFKA